MYRAGFPIVSKMKIEEDEVVEKKNEKTIVVNK